MAGAHPPRPRQRRLGAGGFSRHAAPLWRRSRLPPPALRAAVRRAVRRARRPRRRRAAAPSARSLGRRPHRGNVHASVARSPRTVYPRGPFEPRQNRHQRRTNAAHGGRPRLGLRALRRGLMDFLRQTLVIARKDLRAELRTKEAINAALAFSIVILVLFSFAFDPLEEQTREMSGGLLWIVFAFAGT